MKKFVIGFGTIIIIGSLSCLFYVMVFPPTMIWQEFGRTPIDDLGFAGKNIPLEKADTIYTHRVVLCDVGGKFSPGEYRKKYGDDVAINNLIFTQDKDRVVKFMEEKGVKLHVVNAPYHPKTLARARR